MGLENISIDEQKKYEYMVNTKAIDLYEKEIKGNTINVKEEKKENKYRKIWLDFIKKNKTYEYHLSLTYRYPLPESETKIYLDKLVHYLNCKFYGKNYKNNNRYMEGFVFSELQTNGTSHYHCLIKPDEKFHVSGKPDFEYHVLNEIQKIKKARKTLGEPYRVFSYEGVRAIPIRDKNIVDYCTKTFKGIDDSFIGILSKDGVTWAK